MSTEPQSIIHAVMRISSKLRSPRTPVNRRRRLSLGMDKTQDDQSVTTLSSSETFNGSSRLDNLDMSTLSLLPSDVTTGPQYRTIDQNEFVEELLTDPEAALSFVLFYRTESYFSDNLDKRMSELAEENPNRRCVRISKNLCPLVTSKLNITSQNPTVVAMRRGKVINKISEFSSVECSELKQWVATVELLSR